MTHPSPLRHPAGMPAMDGYDFDDRPFLVFWEITRACALACSHCRAEAQPHRHPEELDSDQSLHLIGQLNEHLLQQAATGRNVVVFLDEAQDFAPDVLEQLRLLSNLETDQHKLMQLVLVGQPELKVRLREPELRQLRQRILARCELCALTAGEVGQYLAFRLQVAGAPDPELFDEAASRLVHRHAAGIPRVINAIADHALLAGYVARVPRITSTEVERVVEDLGDWL